MKVRSQQEFQLLEPENSTGNEEMFGGKRNRVISGLNAHQLKKVLEILEVLWVKENRGWTRGNVRSVF